MPREREGVLLALNIATGQVRETTPEHEAFRTDYYRLVPEDDDPLMVERYLTEADTYLAGLLRGLDEDERLPRGLYFDVLLQTLALLTTRNPKFGDGAERAFEAVVGLIGLFCGDPGVRHDRELRDYAGTFRACLSVVGSTPLRGDFQKRVWSLLIAKPGVGEFVTSDSPVNAETKWGPGWMHGGALSLPESRVVVPLSPRFAMVGQLGGRRRSRRVGYETVASVNGTTIRTARRFVYSMSRDFWWWDAQDVLRGPDDVSLAREQVRIAS